MQEKKIPYSQAIQILDCLPSDIADYMRQGKLTGYTESGRKIFNTDILDNIDGETLDPPLSKRILQERQYAVHLMSLARGQGGLGDISEYTDGWEGMSLSIPKDKKAASEFIEEINGLYFLEKECFYIKNNTDEVDTNIGAGGEIDPDEQIRSIRLWEENGGIIIQQRGKPPRTAGTMGFNPEKNEWKEFKKVVVSDPPHFFTLGKKSDGQPYENRRSLFRSIDKKVKAWLRKELSIQNDRRGFRGFRT